MNQENWIFCEESTGRERQVYILVGARNLKNGANVDARIGKVRIRLSTLDARYNLHSLSPSSCAASKRVKENGRGATSCEIQLSIFWLI